MHSMDLFFMILSVIAVMIIVGAVLGFLVERAVFKKREKELNEYFDKRTDERDL